MFIPLTILDTVANGLMLAVGGTILYFLIRIGRDFKKRRNAQHPFVLLYRGNSGDAAPLGTFLIREHAVAALREAVARNTGCDGPEALTDAILQGFSGDGLSWRGRDKDDRPAHIWVATIPNTGESAR